MESSWSRAVLSLLILAGLLAGCASPPTVPPTGIDGLVIPAVSLDADDFVPTLTSPWVAQTPAQFAGGLSRLQVSLGEPSTVAGVPATPLRFERTVGLSDRITGELVWWLAQDGNGNVWLVGADASGEYGDESWRADSDGSGAGLLVPSAPRVGDGYALRQSGSGVAVVATERVSAYDPEFAEQCGECVELSLTEDGRTATLVVKAGSGVIEWTDPTGLRWTLA